MKTTYLLLHLHVVFMLLVQSLLLSVSYSRQDVKKPVPSANGSISNIERQKTFASSELANDVGRVASSLARSTGNRAIIVLPEYDRYSSVFQAILSETIPNGSLTWKQFLALSNQVGAIAGDVHEKKLTYLIQGRGYPVYKSEALGDCPPARSWKDFFRGYQQLSEPQRKLLMQQEGLIITSLADMPEGFRSLLAVTDDDLKYIDSAPEGTRRRLTFHLEPAAITGFPIKPASAAFGWWYWTYGTVRSDVEKGLVFPESINIFSASDEKEARPLWWKRPMKFQQNHIPLSVFVSTLKRVSNCEVKIDPELKWPSVGVAGGDVTIEEMARCLEVSASVEIRTLPGQDLIFLTSPRNANLLVTPPAVPQDQMKIFTELVNQAHEARGLKAGPLLKGYFQLPVSSISQPWLRVLLSGMAPEGALKEAGSPEAEIYMHDVDGKAFTKWIELYSNGRVASFPSLTINIKYQQITESSKKRYIEFWNTPSMRQAYFTPVCP